MNTQEAIAKLRKAFPEMADMPDNELLTSYFEQYPDEMKKVSDYEPPVNGGAIIMPDEEQQLTPDEMRRQATNPTQEEFSAMDIEKKAYFLMKKRGIPYQDAYGLVAAHPRSAELYMGDQEPSRWRATQTGIKDISSLPGRMFTGAIGTEGSLGQKLGRLYGFGMDDAGYVESVSQPESENIVGSVLRSPYLPLSVGLGGGLSFGARQAGLGKLGKAAFNVFGAAGGSIGAQQTLGENLNPYDMGVEVLGGLLGEGGELALKGVGKRLPGMFANAVEKSGLAGPGVTKEGLEFASGAPWKKLKNWDKLREFSGRQDDIGLELVDKIDDFKTHIKTDIPMVRDALENMPDVSIKPALDKMESFRRVRKGGGPLEEWEERFNSFLDSKLKRYKADNPELDGLIEKRKEATGLPDRNKEISKINDQIKKASENKKVRGSTLMNEKPQEIRNLERIRGEVASGPDRVSELKKLDELIEKAKDNPKTSFIADDVYDLRVAIDQPVDFKKLGEMGASAANDRANEMLMAARTEMKKGLESAAEKSGNKDYILAMKRLSEKFDAHRKLAKLVGHTKDSRQLRAESFISNLNGKNKSERQRIMSQFDKMFGSDISEKAKIASYADQFGRGTPGLLPTHKTGKGAAAQVLLTGGAASPLISTRGIMPTLMGIRDVTSSIPQGAGAATGTRLADLYKFNEENR